MNKYCDLSFLLIEPLITLGKMKVYINAIFFFMLIMLSAFCLSI